MSIQALLSSDGVEEVFTPPTLKEMCLHKCVMNKDILTKEVEVDKAATGSEKLDWEKFRLRKPLPRKIVEAFLNAGEKYLFMLTPEYEPLVAAIRMSQPEHFVKVHLTNTDTLEDRQLELLLSGGNVKSLDIHGCKSLRCRSLDAINKLGNGLEYLRLGNCVQILLHPKTFRPSFAILRTPNLKTFIVIDLVCPLNNVTNYWRFLLQDFISNLEELQISQCGNFETLEFLEPAKYTLSSLTWSQELPTDMVLDLVGAWTWHKFVGGNIMQRLLAAMPNLTSLAIYPCPVKDIYVEVNAPIRGQGLAAKRLEFLGILKVFPDKDEADLRKAKLLASDVGYFGTFEGEMRILEYFSNRRGIYFYFQVESLLFESSCKGGGMGPSKMGTVITLFLKSFKYFGFHNLDYYKMSYILKPLLSTEVAAKLGDWEFGLLLDQFIEASLRRWSCYDGKRAKEMQNIIITDVVDLMMNLDGELCFDHYATVVPRLMRMAEVAMANSVLDHITERRFMGFLEKIAELLEKAVNWDRFSGETDALWGISSVLVVMKELKDVMVWRNTIGLVKIFCSLIACLRKLCLNSGPRRAAFLSANGAKIVMELLTDIMDGYLAGFADGDSFALLEILRSILEDTKLDLDLSESEMIATGLEKLLLFVHSQWELSKSSYCQKFNNYWKMESITNLLNHLDSDPRFDYKASGTEKEIMMKFK